MLKYLIRMLVEQKILTNMLIVIGICVIGIAKVSGHVSTSDESSDDNSES